MEFSCEDMKMYIDSILAMEKTAFIQERVLKMLYLALSETSRVDESPTVYSAARTYLILQIIGVKSKSLETCQRIDELCNCGIVNMNLGHSILAIAGLYNRLSQKTCFNLQSEYDKLMEEFGGEVPKNFEILFSDSGTAQLADDIILKASELIETTSLEIQALKAADVENPIQLQDGSAIARYNSECDDKERECMNRLSL